jgi:hypothetical protein
MKECEHLIKRDHLYKICCGTANIPKWKIDQYREKMGLSKLFNEEKSTIKREIKERVLDYNTIGYGVGSELLEIYKKSGVPPCQQCFKLAQQMNIWGEEGCIQNMDYIIGDIMPRAKEWLAENKPWAHKLLPDLIEDSAIKIKLSLDIKLAIHNYNIKKNINKLAKSEKGCNCGK